MPNTQTQKDRLRESLVKSLIDMVRTDLAVAWGGAVEVVEGNPDFDWDRRPKPDGTTEARDLAAKPLIVVSYVGGMTGPWAIAPREDRSLRSTILRIDMAAASHRDIINLSDTVESILDGSENSTGGFALKDPDTFSGIGVVAYFDDQNRLAEVFSGPGQTTDFEAQLPEGKSQFENLKHRASIVLTVDIAKARGSKVA